MAADDVVFASPVRLVVHAFASRKKALEAVHACVADAKANGWRVEQVCEINEIVRRADDGELAEVEYEISMDVSRDEVPLAEESDQGGLR